MKLKINRLSTLERQQILRRALEALRKNEGVYWRGRLVQFALPDPRLKW